MKLFLVFFIYLRFNFFQLFYYRGIEDFERIVIYRFYFIFSQVNVMDLDFGEYYYFWVQV